MKCTIAAVMLVVPLFVAGCGGGGLESAKMPEVSILQVENSITFNCRTIEFTDTDVIGGRRPHRAETLNFLYKKVEEWKKAHPEWRCMTHQTHSSDSFCSVTIALEKTSVQPSDKKTAAN